MKKLLLISGAAAMLSNIAAAPESKITLCHNNQVTITVSTNAWPAHEAHGDWVGACGEQDPPTGDT